jgi:hypothetical protein
MAPVCVIIWQFLSLPYLRTIHYLMRRPVRLLVLSQLSTFLLILLFHLIDRPAQKTIMITEWQSKTLANGIHAFVGGCGSGTPVILLPGWPETADACTKCFQHFQSSIPRSRSIHQVSETRMRQQADMTLKQSAGFSKNPCGLLWARATT